MIEAARDLNALFTASCAARGNDLKARDANGWAPRDTEREFDERGMVSLSFRWPAHEMYNIRPALVTSPTKPTASPRWSPPSSSIPAQEATRLNLNVQPTFTERPGLPLRVIVNRDLILRPYQPLIYGRSTQ